MSRFPLFLVSSALIGIGLIGFSVSSAWPRPARAVEAQMRAGSMVFNTETLNALMPAPGSPVTPAPGPRGDQTGPRLASGAPFGQGQNGQVGARLALGPTTQAALGTKPVTMTVTFRGIPKSASKKIAFGLVTGGPINWVEANVPTDFAAVRLDMPPTRQPVQAIAIWPSTQGQNRGVEIRSMTLQTPPS
jgi:hypothetical protein